jgi:hypothetical protein
LSSLLTAVQKLATSREAGRRVEGLLPDSILQKSINVVLWMSEKEQALQLHRLRFGEVHIVARHFQGLAFISSQ